MTRTQESYSTSPLIWAWLATGKTTEEIYFLIGVEIQFETDSLKKI